MTTLTNAQSFSKETELKVLSTSSVWNFHGADHIDNIALKVGTNLNNELKRLKANGVDGMVTLYADSIARSGHGKTSVTIYAGVANSDNCSIYYSRRIGEVRMDRV